MKSASGNVLSYDEAHGAHPFAIFASEKSDRVSVILIMTECDEDVCEYGLGMYALADRRKTAH